MVKCFFIQLIVILSLSFFNCGSGADTTAVKPARKDSILSPADTFLSVKLYESPDYIQPGFIFDSLELENKKTSSTFSAYFPRLSKHEYPLPYQWLHRIINVYLKSFRREVAAGEDSLIDESVDTKLLYRDDRIFSIVMSESSSAYGMNTSWDHFSINYDIDKKKIIGLNDYFILKTKEDTSFLNRFLDQCVGGNRNIDIRRFDDLSRSFTFAVDSANVYLFFGRYDVFVGIGDYISIVPKKYVMEHINPAYR